MTYHVDYSKMAPCPFCGQQGDYYINCEVDSLDEWQYSVECANCNATYYGNPSNVDTWTALAYAVDGWNYRA